MTITSTDISTELAAYRARRAAFKLANPDAMFFGHQGVYCIDCAGATLEGAIVMSRKGQKNFSGFNGERVVRLSAEEVVLERAAWAESGLILSCECGKVK